jgi:GNAT superfamily N-acetyltransferase
MFGSYTRQLGPRDCGELAALLAREPGYSVFLGHNLDMFGLKYDAVRYWGVFAHSRLAGALMVVERRMAIYAPPDGDLETLGRLAGDLDPDFIMGRADLLDAVLREHPELAIADREDHIFAKVAPRDFSGDHPAAPGIVVRRAGHGDVAALTALYTGAEGFEQMTTEQIARTLQGRILTLRTYVAEAGGQAVAGASTSAETREAAMVGGVWTAPAWRNRGLSTAVVGALSGELLHEGRTPYLFYRVNNAAAARVYAQLGYHPIGRWMVVNFDRRDSA